jgi:SAM-dependent methyltransferase
MRKGKGEKEKIWWRDFFDENYREFYQNLEPLTKKEVDLVVRLLDLKPGAKVLDLCCGYGRHCVEMAQRGYRVTGYDLSKFFISKARKTTRELGLKIDFLEGDMRMLPFKNEFDAVINMFTSFGFFEKEEDDLKVLKGVSKALKPNGAFFLDTINREALVRNFRPKHWMKRKGFVMLEEGFLDLFLGRWESTRTLIFEDDRRRNYSISLRAYCLVEFINLLKQARLALEGVYGDFDSNQYTIDSPRMIVVARKI